MTIHRHKPVIAIAAVMLLTMICVAVILSEPFLFFLPAGLLAALVFLQYPRLAFYGLMASIPWSAEVHFSSGLSTDLPDEALMLFTAFTALLLWLQKAKGASRRKSFHPLLFLLIVSIGWLMISAFVSTHPLFSIKYIAAKQWYLLAFVAAPLLLGDDKTIVKNGAIVLFVSMFAVTLLTMFQHAKLGFTFATINEALKPYFRNHVNYSALLVLMVPVQIAFLQLAKNKWLRRGLIASILLVVTALYFSYSRGAWLALIIGLSGYWLIRKGWLFRAFLAGVMVVAFGISWLVYQDRYLQFAPDHNSTIFHQDFSEHLVATYKGKDVSTAERFYRWAAGARMAAERPLTGFGPSTFYSNYQSYTVPAFRTWVSVNREKSTVHNYFLLLLVEQGIPGLLLFVSLLGAAFWYAQKIYQREESLFWKVTVAAVGAILLMQCTVNFLSDLVETDKVGSVFYLCVAVLVMADRRRGHPLKTMSDNAGKA